MSQIHGLNCDGGCGSRIAWETTTGQRTPTKSVMEKFARSKGWHAPDRIGRHFCLRCRTEAGRIQWWRKENVRRGLVAGYGLGSCPGLGCGTGCVSAGHPGVDSRV